LFKTIESISIFKTGNNNTVFSCNKTVKTPPVEMG